MNDWNEKFGYSISSQQIKDIGIIKRHLPGCISVEKTGEDLDRKGIDYIATLRGGATVLVDAKTRMPGSKQYWKNGEVELALETWSVVESKKPGWPFKQDSNVDYILYTFDSSDWDKCYFFPFQLLRKAFIQHYNEWIEKYGRKTQVSNSWTSECIFVPASVIVSAVSEAMEIPYRPRSLLIEALFDFCYDQIKRAAYLVFGYEEINGCLYFNGEYIREIER